MRRRYGTRLLLDEHEHHLRKIHTWFPSSHLFKLEGVAAKLKGVSTHQMGRFNNTPLPSHIEMCGGDFDQITHTMRLTGGYHIFPPVVRIP